MTKVTSMRGEVVDFGLFAIKERLANAPKNDNVKQRERFIDKKRRRGVRNKQRIEEMLNVTPPVVVDETVEKTDLPLVEDLDESNEKTATSSRRKVVKND